MRPPISVSILLDQVGASSCGIISGLVKIKARKTRLDNFAESLFIDLDVSEELLSHQRGRTRVIHPLHHEVLQIWRRDGRGLSAHAACCESMPAQPVPFVNGRIQRGHTYFVPFQIAVPDSLPPSFSLLDQYVVRYEICASLHLSPESPSVQKVKCPAVLIARRVVPSVCPSYSARSTTSTAIMTPLSLAIPSTAVVNPRVCRSCPNGFEVTIATNKTCFAAGETIFLHLESTNTSSRSFDTIKVCLLRSATEHINGGRIWTTKVIKWDFSGSDFKIKRRQPSSATPRYLCLSLVLPSPGSGSGRGGLSRALQLLSVYNIRSFSIEWRLRVKFGRGIFATLPLVFLSPLTYNSCLFNGLSSTTAGMRLTPTGGSSELEPPFGNRDLHAISCLPPGRNAALTCALEFQARDGQALGSGGQLQVATSFPTAGSSRSTSTTATTCCSIPCPPEPHHAAWAKDGQAEQPAVDIAAVPFGYSPVDQNRQLAAVPAGYVCRDADSAGAGPGWHTSAPQFEALEMEAPSGKPCESHVTWRLSTLPGESSSGCYQDDARISTDKQQQQQQQRHLPCAEDLKSRTMQASSHGGRAATDHD